MIFLWDKRYYWRKLGNGPGFWCSIGTFIIFYIHGIVVVHNCPSLLNKVLLYKFITIFRSKTVKSLLLFALLSLALYHPQATLLPDNIMATRAPPIYISMHHHPFACLEYPPMSLGLQMKLPCFNCVGSALHQTSLIYHLHCSHSLTVTEALISHCILLLGPLPVYFCVYDCLQSHLQQCCHWPGSDWVSQ